MYNVKAAEYKNIASLNKNSFVQRGNILKCDTPSTLQKVQMPQGRGIDVKSDHLSST